MVVHDQRLDIYPVFRAWECTANSEYRADYHPYISAENNDKYYRDVANIARNMVNFKS